jgi:hypothetical protein
MTILSADTDQAGRSGRGVRRWLTTAAVAVAVITVVGAITVTKFGSGSGAHPVVGSKATTTASVQRMDLAEMTPVSGKVGFASPFTIVQPAGISPQAVTQAQQAAAQAHANLAADVQALSDTNASDAQGMSQAAQALATAQAALTAGNSLLQADEAALAADKQTQARDCQDRSGSASSTAGPGQPGGSTPCGSDTTHVNTDQQSVAADQQKLTGDQAAVQDAQAQLLVAQQKQAQGNDQGQAKVAGDQLAVTNAESALSTAETAATVYGPTSRYTALPGVGEVIHPGQALWSVDGQPVVLLPGTLIPWRAFSAGMPGGPDVAALDQALIDLGDGDGLAISNTFTNATAAAIDRLRASLGVPQTGILTLGAAVFAPAAMRVTAVHPLVGAPVTGGGPVLDVTSTTPVVNVALPVDRAYRVKVGDPVSVNLPDGTTSAGTVTGVGAVATDTTQPNSGSTATSATVNVTVSLTKASPAATLDQAPVTVNITNASAHQVLAVPTTALLAVAGGGYALEMVQPNGVHQLVGVTAGIFDDQSGMVQVSGSGLAVGQQVVAAT